MATQLELDDIRRAWEARDPELVQTIASCWPHSPTSSRPLPSAKGPSTFAKFLREINSHAFRRKPLDEQQHYRVEQMKAPRIAAGRGAAARPAAPPRNHHGPVERQWPVRPPLSASDHRHACDLSYGPWRALKRIFKEAEAQGDTEILGALAARFDMAYGAAASRSAA